MTDQTPAKHQAAFADKVSQLANVFLTQIVDQERVQQASGRLALAIRQAAASNPKLYDCSLQSVAECVAKSALTGLMPGGVKPLVWLIPRGSRLEWQVSVRGLQALAERVGWRSIVARPVHVEDHYEVILGSEDRIEHKPCGKWPANLDELRGMYVRGQHESGLTVCVDVPVGVVLARKAKSQSGNVWSQWPIEMAQARAVGWAISRGYFGSLEQSTEMSVALQQPAEEHREPAPVRQSQRPAAIAYEADEAAFDAALDAEEVAK